MKETDFDFSELTDQQPEEHLNTKNNTPNESEHASYNPAEHQDTPYESHRLGGMYQNWFLEYASYVILDRAVPNLSDGLKPVQRRILHSMKQMDDGRLNKVANIVGNTMKYHPHGDQSIYSALVTLGQKDLLIDCQGNWGNILTGDGAAAPRYIEARLSKFALDVVFNAKTTEWKLSYDGRNKEPITLPVKFPLLLCQGAEGIAVGLNAKILPHNFNELCDAAISHLEGKQFQLFPDFQTGGSIDVSHYNDGARGGSLKIRAKINKIDNKTLSITEIPFGKNVRGIIESILKAGEKGKIKIKHIDDTTSENANIIINLQPGVSPDKTIDALYAFTDCEVSVAPNCCVIEDRTPRFLSVSDVLIHSVEQTKELLRKELLIHKAELEEQLHFASLESIFINERIYKDKKFEQAPDIDAACRHIDDRLTPWYPKLIREVTKDDILKLMQIKMQRILKFNADKAEELIVRLRSEIEKTENDLKDIIGVTKNWFIQIKEKYGAKFPRRTQLSAFDQIEAAKVTEQNQKLYINREEGFIGTSLKKDEFVSPCSDLDDVILFYKDGTYRVTKVSDKLFVGETERSKAEGKKAEIIHVAVFKKNDKRTIYNVIYRDGKKGLYYMKRFYVSGIIRDRDNDLTKGTPGSKVVYFTANPNGEAEIVRITLKPDAKVRRLTYDINFANLAIKGRAAQGNIASRTAIYRINLKSHGISTLGGRKVWFDKVVKRLNYDEHGQYLGEFQGDDKILVILDNGEFYTTNTDINNHYEDNILYIGKYNQSTVWSVAYENNDTDHTPYIKRFQLDATARHQNIFTEETKSTIYVLTNHTYPRIKTTFGGNSSYKEPMETELYDFVSIKGFKARGKRLTNLEISSIEELEPIRQDEIDDPENNEPSNLDDEPLETTETQTDDEIKDEINGQLRLF